MTGLCAGSSRVVPAGNRIVATFPHHQFACRTLKPRRPEESGAIVAPHESPGREVAGRRNDMAAIDLSGTRLVLTALDAEMNG